MQAFSVSVHSVWNSFNPGLCSIITLGSSEFKLKTTLFLVALSGDN